MGEGGARREWVLATAIAIGITLLVQAPYWVGYAATPSGMMYTGLLINVEDANYLTIVQRGSEGAWTHSLRFTSEPDAPAFLYVFYLALGHAARLVGADATTMWHVARGVMTFATCLVAFGFVRTFVAGFGVRLTAYLFATVGAGFDWAAFPGEVLGPTSAMPADLKMPDAHLFHAALTFPHYLGSIVLLMVLFWCAVRLVNEKLTRGRFAALLVLGAVANVGIVLVYPFFVLLACGVLVVYLALLMLRERRILWREGVIVGALILPVVPVAGYYAYALASSELLRVWSAQSQTLSPNPLHYVLTFLPYLVLGGVTLRGGLGDNKRVLLWAWILTVVVLAYAPMGAQRRFLQGVQVPLAILAAIGLFEVALPRLERAGWFQRLAERPNYSVKGLERLIVVLVILLVSISSVYQWLSAMALVTVQQPYPIFRPMGEVAAMDELRGEAGADEVVLSSYFTGSYLPLRSGTRVYLGHLYETIHFEEKQEQAARFFGTGMGDAERLEFLRANGIGYVFYGRSERVLGDFAPEDARYLAEVIRTDDAVVYRVVAP